MVYKTKSELELMSRGDILVYRDKLITSKSKDDIKISRYDNELLFYMDVRFREHTMSQISSWLQEMIDKGSMRSNNPKGLYLTGLLEVFPDDNTFVYITPMDMPPNMPIDYLIKMRVHFDIFTKK